MSADRWWEGEVEAVPPPRRLFGYDWAAGYVAPFQPSHADVIAAAITDVQAVLGTGPLRCVDVGCGDGKVAIAAASVGWEVVGIDIDDALLEAARAQAESAGLSARTTFLHQDLTTYDALQTDFDVIVVYLLPDLFRRHAAVTRRLWRAVTERGAVVVSMRWALDDSAECEWSALRAPSPARDPPLPYQHFVYTRRPVAA